MADALDVSLTELLGAEEHTPTPQEKTEPIVITDDQDAKKEIERLLDMLEAKDDLIKRMQREESRIRTASEKLLSALHSAYIRWYLDRLPSKKNALDKIVEDDLTFWLQFFSIEAVKMALEMAILPNTPFQGTFEKYKSMLTKDIHPYASRSNDVHELWLSAIEYIQKNDLYTANKHLDKLNESLE